MADGKARSGRSPDSTAHDDKPECFVVMPISEPDGYPPEHFQHVFDDIFTPACDMAGFRAVRADQVRETNLIHLDVLQRLLDSPMVLCDLSSRNPNVLFELGLRQAFDRPVVLVQEVGTPKIFDITPLRYSEYRRARIYHEVLEDQKAIAQSLVSTREAYQKGTGVNSIVRILSITQPAKLVDVQEANKDPALQLVRAELSELRSAMQRLVAHRRFIDEREIEDDRARADLGIARELVLEAQARLAEAAKGGPLDPTIPDRISKAMHRLERVSIHHSEGRQSIAFLDKYKETMHRLARLNDEYRAALKHAVAKAGS